MTFTELDRDEVETTVTSADARGLMLNNRYIDHKSTVQETL